MERMEGVDAGYLYMETPTQHMHTLKIALIGPAPTFDFGRFTGALMDRLDRLAPLRRRVLPVPFALNHPVWIEDRLVDPQRHIVRHVLPAPGEMAELEELIGRIAGTPLDRRLPLWEMHVCEGLSGDRFAVVTKMHHSIADGAAANALLTNVTDAFDPRPPGPGPGAAPLEATPSRLALVGSALWDAIRQTVDLPSLVWRTGRAVAAVVRHKRGASVAVPRPMLDVPRVSFNGALTARRSFATCTLPMDQIKDVRRRHGVTVNDVVLGVVAGALRQWMDERGERPRAPLTAGVPVGTDVPGAPVRLTGNRVSNLFTTLATDIDEPGERLQEIARVTAEAKAVQRTLGHDMLTDWVQYTPPAPFTAAMRLYSRSGAAALHPAPFNVVVSNVPGLRETAEFSGTALDDFFSVGPILEGIGLNVTVWSYADRMNFSLLSCPDLLRDLGPLVACFRPALEELRQTGREGR